MTDTLRTALERAATDTRKGYTFLGNDLSETHYSFAALYDAVRERGRHLQALGLRKGDRVALIIPENEDFVISFLGAVSVGVVPVPMYPPLALGKLDHYVDTAARILEAAGARMLITTKRVAPVLWSLVGRVRCLEDLVLVEKLREPTTFEGWPVELAPNDPCFLQFTSGSTSTPKGVVVTHGNLVRNGLDIMFEGLASDPERDMGLSWLPLYHDMGLIGFVIAPLFAGVPVVFLQTMAFVKRPTIWLECMSKYGATMSFAPNFAYALAAKYAGRLLGKPDFDLSHVRVFGCGAEPINADTMRSFLEAYRPAGLRESSLMPCYGMAEATLAISFDRIGTSFETIVIDSDKYESEHVAERYEGNGGGGREIVSCGRAFSTHQVRIVDDNGHVLPEGAVGEIVICGPSVASGYFKNEEATRETFRDGWLYSGDLGFIRDGQVYVSGRKKDLIILNGRNYYPQAIEWELESLPGIRKGNVVAFSVPTPSSEELVVVAETRTSDERDQLKKTIRHHLKTCMGLAAKDVVLLDAGALPKTSSGKLQRRKTREEYLDGTIGSGTRTLGSRASRAVVARHLTRSVFARFKHRVRKVRTSWFPGPAPQEDSNLPTKNDPATGIGS